MNDMRRAKLKFAVDVTDWQITAARAARRGVGRTFHQGYRTLHIGTTNQRLYGYTNERGVGAEGEMRIRFNPTFHDGASRDQRIGRLAQTLTHEMYVHARRDLSAQRSGRRRSGARVDHIRMHDPDRRGGFLNASRGTFLALENEAQKQAFADEWYRDVKSEIERARLSPADTKRRVRWARRRRNSMLDAIDYPEDHAWSAPPPPPPPPPPVQADAERRRRGCCPFWF